LHTEPALQVVPTVQALPSSQGFPVKGCEKQPPGSVHCPAWQPSVPDAEQSVDVPPVHTPAWHVSPTVQANVSLHAGVPGLAGFEQRPLPGAQTPALWHWSEGEQTTGLPPAHEPFEQVSVCVQASPSVQAGPVSGVTAQELVPLHARVLQASLVQVMPVPAQLPAPLQVSV
jgi:hypothetical protein